MQSKWESAKESALNTLVGMAISFASTYWIFPLCGVNTNSSQNAFIVFLFTGVSFVRQFIIRRIYEWRERRRLKSGS